MPNILLAFIALRLCCTTMINTSLCLYGGHIKFAKLYEYISEETSIFLCRIKKLESSAAGETQKSESVGVAIVVKVLYTDTIGKQNAVDHRGGESKIWMED